MYDSCEEEGSAILIFRTTINPAKEKESMRSNKNETINQKIIMRKCRGKTLKERRHKAPWEIQKTGQS